MLPGRVAKFLRDHSVTLPWHEFLSDCASLLQKNGWNYALERYVELLDWVLQPLTCASAAE